MRHRLNALEGLRGAAALLVVMNHALGDAVNKLHIVNMDVRLADRLGQFGVYTFFVISGLVMVLSHHQDFNDRSSWKSFMAKRIARIVPLYWLVTLVQFVKLKAAPGVAGLLYSLLFIPHQEAGSRFGRPLYELGWTLQFEMFFYLVFAAVLALGVGFRAGVALIATFFVAFSGAWATGLVGGSNAVGYLAEPVTLFFVAGLLIGTLKVWSDAALLKIGATLGTVTAIVAVTTWALLSAGLSPSAALVLEAAAAIVSIVLCTFERRSETGGRLRFAAAHLGAATYAVYLTHAFVIGPAARAASKAPLSVPVWLYVPSVMAIALVVGALVHRYVDGPLSRWLRKLLLNSRATA